MRSVFFLLQGAAVALAALAGCVQPPDLEAVQVERGKSVLRTDMFQAVAANASVWVAGGAAGVLVRSADRGKTWARQELATPSSLIGMTTCADGSFAALDFYKKVWFADAQASQWIARPLPEGLSALTIACDAGNRVWVGGGNTTLAMSADRGQNWTARKLGGDAYINTLQFVDAQHGFATGEFGIVLTTADAGATWVKQPPIPDDFYPYAAVFIDSRRGWASGLGGGVQQTEDGGKSWTRQDNRSGGALHGLVRQGERLYGVGGPALAVLEKSRWARFESAPAAAAPLVAVVAPDANTLLAVGYGGAIHRVTTFERGTQAARAATN